MLCSFWGTSFSTSIHCLKATQERRLWQSTTAAAPQQKHETHISVHFSHGTPLNCSWFVSALIQPGQTGQRRTALLQSHVALVVMECDVTTDPAGGCRGGRRCPSRYGRDFVAAASAGCGRNQFEFFKTCHFCSLRGCTCLRAGCSTAVNDLVYIVDGSWSVGFPDFETAKQWLINITSLFDISSHYTQVLYTALGIHLSVHTIPALFFFSESIFKIQFTFQPRL